MFKVLTVEELKSGNGVASSYLREDENLPTSGEVLNIAYTNYGGDSFDYVLIEYLIENYAEDKDYIVEDASYNGRNMIVINQQLVKDIVSSSDDYLLGFKDIEKYYYKKEAEVLDKEIDYFLDWYEYENPEEVKTFITEELYDMFSFNITNMNYCESDVIDALAENGFKIIE